MKIGILFFIFLAGHSSFADCPKTGSYADVVEMEGVRGARRHNIFCFEVEATPTVYQQVGSSGVIITKSGDVEFPSLTEKIAYEKTLGAIVEVAKDLREDPETSFKRVHIRIIGQEKRASVEQVAASYGNALPKTVIKLPCDPSSSSDFCIGVLAGTTAEDIKTFLLFHTLVEEADEDETSSSPPGVYIVDAQADRVADKLTASAPVVVNPTTRLVTKAR